MSLDPSNEAATVPAEPPGHVTAERDGDGSLVVANRRYGRYLGIEEIARGGMGRVLRAYDPKLRREVALKVMRGEATSEGRARVLREAQALARLAHPNVVAVFDVEEADGKVFLALEYVQGQTLRQWLQARPRSVADVLAMFTEAGRGLAAAHAAGLVHRDVKPANILVGDDGRVRVTDFGLARAPFGNAATTADSLDDDDAPGSADLAITRVGTVLGTPRYMAPEQHAGGEVDPRTDQYAFCVALFEALVGRAPFEGRDPAELMTRKRAGPPTWPRALPAWLGVVLLRGLAVMPELRHRTMDDLLEALADDPTRRRRRWRMAGLGVLAIGAVVGARQWMVSAAEERCAVEGRAIDATWNEDGRARVQAAFASVDSPLAAATFERVQPWLDGYAERWRDTAVASCRAVEIEGSRTADLAQRARDCLTEKREALAALREQLENVDTALVGTAITASAMLPQLSECADEDALRRRPQPLEPALRAEVAAVRAEIMRVRAGLSAGRWQAAMDRSQMVLASARALQYEPLLVEAVNTVGMAQMRLGQFAEAEQSLEDAFFSAGRIGHDDAALEAAQRLTYVVGLRLARGDEGMRWGRIAQMLVERTGQTERLRGADVANDIGGIHVSRVEWDLAAEQMERARAIFAHELPDDHPMHARMLANLAAIESGRGHHAAALAQTRAALAALERAVGPEHPDVATMHDNIAILQTNMGEDPVPELRLAIAIRERALGPDHPDLARSISDLAAALAERGGIAEATALLERARALLDAAYPADHPEVARWLSQRAAVHEAAGRTDDARADLEKARALYLAAYGPEHRDTQVVDAELAQLDHSSR